MSDRAWQLEVRKVFYKCCVESYKGDYKSCDGYAASFNLPKDEPLPQKWKHMIPRVETLDFKFSGKNSRVSGRHIDKACVMRYYELIIDGEAGHQQKKITKS